MGNSKKQQDVLSGASMVIKGEGEASHVIYSDQITLTIMDEGKPFGVITSTKSLKEALLADSDRHEWTIGQILWRNPKAPALGAIQTHKTLTHKMMKKSRQIPDGTNAVKSREEWISDMLSYPYGTPQERFPDLSNEQIEVLEKIKPLFVGLTYQESLKVVEALTGQLKYMSVVSQF